MIRCLSVYIILISFFACNDVFADDSINIDFKIESIDSKTIKASLDDEDFKQQDCNVKLIASNYIVKYNSSKSHLTYIITWDKYISNSRVARLTNPISSVLTLKKNLAKADVINLKANISELERICSSKVNISSKEDVKQKNETSKNSVAETRYSGSSNRNYEYLPQKILPNISYKEQDVFTKTTSGCDLIIDQENMKAIKQERTLKNGVEYSPCVASNTSFALQKQYASCPDQINPDVMQAFRAYRLFYVDTNSNSAVTVSDCIADKNDSYEILETREGCDIRNDFENSVSYFRSRKIYKDVNQKIIEVTSCADESEGSMQHFEDDTVCQDQVDNARNIVIKSSRKYINVASGKRYIGECLPKENGIFKIEQEDCEQAKYSHNFTNKESFLNVNFFYIDNATKKYISKCVTSEQKFNHYEDSSVCDIYNDDKGRFSRIYAQTYITANNDADNGDKIYLNQCHAVGDKIPYINLKNKWQVVSGYQANLKTNSNYIKLQKPTITSYTSFVDFIKNSFGWNAINVPGQGGMYWVCDKKYSVCSWNFMFPFDSNGNYCMTNSLVAPWVTIDGVDLDIENSDASPKWDLDVQTKSYLEGNCKQRTSRNIYDYLPSQSYGCIADNGFTYYGCTIPSCQVTELTLHPLWQRADMSTFLDKDVILDRKQICGNGNKLLDIE